MTDTARRPGSLREALAAKTSLRTHHDISVVDTDVAQAAQRKLEAARSLETATMLHDDPDIRERAAAAVRDAEDARDACFHRIWCRGLTPNEFDALVALHPPSADEERAGKPWGASFDVALLAEAVEDSDLTAEDWETEFASGRWSAADRRRLLVVAMDAQRQTLADAVPKG